MRELAICLRLSAARGDFQGRDEVPFLWRRSVSEMAMAGIAPAQWET
jgi:hypothetical protein